MLFGKVLLKRRFIVITCLGSVAGSVGNFTKELKDATHVCLLQDSFMLQQSQFDSIFIFAGIRGGGSVLVPASCVVAHNKDTIPVACTIVRLLLSFPFFNLVL